MTKEQLELKVKELNAALTQFETDQATLKEVIMTLTMQTTTSMTLRLTITIK
jgi:hypothetical protein